MDYFSIIALIVLAILLTPFIILVIAEWALRRNEGEPNKILRGIRHD